MAVVQRHHNAAGVAARGADVGGRLEARGGGQVQLVVHSNKLRGAQARGVEPQLGGILLRQKRLVKVKIGAVVWRDKRIYPTLKMRGAIAGRVSKARYDKHHL